MFLRLRAAREEPFDIEWMVPAVDRLKRWCAARGLRTEQEDDMVIYELPLEALRNRWGGAENPPAAAPEGAGGGPHDLPEGDCGLHLGAR